MRPIVIEFNRHTLTGALLDDLAPEICRRIWQQLPLEGETTNATWCGEMLHLWVEIAGPEQAENVAQLDNPGDILFIPQWKGLGFVYGQARMQGPSGPIPVPRVGRIRGDLTSLAEFAHKIAWEGARPMRIKRG